MTDIFPKSIISDLIEEEEDSVEVNGYELRAIHSTMSEFHITIYDEDGEMVGTLDGNRYSTVEEMWQDARVQVGLERHEDTLGDLFG